jgi:hypothetical protein
VPNFPDSDDDIHNAQVEDIFPSDDQSSSDDEAPTRKKALKTKAGKKQPPKKDISEGSSDSEVDEDDDEDDLAAGSDAASDHTREKTKTKRNDPSAFANSLSKILSTKIPASKRADPVLVRSAEAHEASRAAVDNALESKARKQMREQKRRALEKGRVRDVLIATKNDTTGELESSTVDIMETERTLRKVAQRGVVKLFNAVRAAQVAAVEADKGVKKDGIIGMSQREEKVSELTKKGFLDLIASGGGGLKKGGLEEA